MVDGNRNIKSGLLVLVLMIFFFSWLQREKDKHNETNQSVISISYISNHQAIIVPEISNHGPDFFCIKKLNPKNPYPDCHTPGVLTLNKPISRCNTSHQVIVCSNNPIIGLFSPQKVPEKGNDDDILSII